MRIPFRPKKDPRDLKVLDPAGGSGHFLLYAFDLLVKIYEEGWLDEAAPVSEMTGRSLRQDYIAFDNLRRAIPGLILRHNLHGIDIDLRATQIAALALWMRAQRAYKEFGIERAERLAIAKTNLVVAEPMPGEKDLRQEFISSLDKRLAGLLGQVFETMELAGEAGALLKIEDIARSAIRSIYGETGELFRKSDEERWAFVDVALRTVLDSYGRKSEGGSGYGRRLFVEDSRQGLAFLDVCTQRYDVLLTNPPFGTASRRTKGLIDDNYPRSSGDLLANFVERMAGWLTTGGRAGLITSRTPFYLRSFEEFRSEVVRKEATPTLFLDLGDGVLDAMVETCAWVFDRQAAGRHRHHSTFIRLVVEGEKQASLANCLHAIASGTPDSRVFVRNPDQFQALRGRLGHIGFLLRQSEHLESGLELKAPQRVYASDCRQATISDSCASSGRCRPRRCSRRTPSEMCPVTASRPVLMR